MSRDITGASKATIDTPGSYKIYIKARAFKTNIYFDAITSNYPVTGADAQGLVDDPMKAEIVYNATAGGLVTFWCDGSLKYSIEGSSTVTTTTYSCSGKPGIYGSKLYMYTGGSIRRYSINWSSIASRSTNPLSLDATYYTASLTVPAIHGISTSECVAFVISGGPSNTDMITPYYLSATIDPTEQNTSSFAFMKVQEWEGDDTRDLDNLAIHSSAGTLGVTKVFAYISDAATGQVVGKEYDTYNRTWGDTFVAVPTDIEISLCEFRISNGYTISGDDGRDIIYMAGQLDRKDAIDGTQPASLILYSYDGKTFSLDRFTRVSDLGYRFLAHVGSDNYLYLANSNRVCKAPVTWIFNGIDTDQCAYTDILQTDIKSVNDSDAESLSMSILSGHEEYWDDANIAETSLLRFYVGYEGVATPDWIEYGRYIIESVNLVTQAGSRQMIVNATGEAFWRLSGLSMPFYAEFVGKSSVFSHILDDSGDFYTPERARVYEESIFVDFWKNEPWENTHIGITGLEMNSGGGVNGKSFSGSHKAAFITSEDIKDAMNLAKHPEVMRVPFTINVYGWSHATTTGDVNDTISGILVCEDLDGNEKTIFSADTGRWSQTYPEAYSGEDPIALTFTVSDGIASAWKVKRVGLVVEAANATVFCPARMETVDWSVLHNVLSDDFGWEQLDRYMECSSFGIPYIEFAQKPYNPKDFCISAIFENTVENDASLSINSCGLVGYATDTMNYVVARYNKVNGKMELVRVINGVGFTLQQSSDISASMPTDDTVGVQFRVNDGKFRVYYLNSSGKYIQCISYNWTPTTIYMKQGDTEETLKCGVYAYVDAPFVKTMGLYSGYNENQTFADGIAADPTFSISAFPSTGRLKMGGAVYEYASKVDFPTPVRGPYQFRQAGVYASPYGNGSAGMEVRDFGWGNDTDILNGYLISVDNGASFVCNGAKWDVWIKTGGSQVYQYDRARYYSENSQIKEISFTGANRVWILGGFVGLTQILGEEQRHSIGDFASLYIDGKITLKWYMGSGGEPETSIADLLQRVGALCGTQIEFPGDELYAGIGSGDSNRHSVWLKPYAEGFDITFEMGTTYGPFPFSLYINVAIDPTNYINGDDYAGDTELKMTFDHVSGSTYEFTLQSWDSAEILYQCEYDASGITTATWQKIRVILHENFLSFYHNGIWVMTWGGDLVYDYEVGIDMEYSGPTYFDYIRIKELPDWREAIYIDLDTDGSGAFQSVLQERPVDIVSGSTGTVKVFYDIDRDTIVQAIEPRRHGIKNQVPRDGGSDGIIQSAIDVKTIFYSPYAALYGLSTKLLKFPSLINGAVKAGYIALRKAFETRNEHDLTIRPDPSIEVGDILSVDYQSFGTNRDNDYDIIVEAVSLSISAEQSTVRSSMQVKGRESV